MARLSDAYPDMVPDREAKPPTRLDSLAGRLDAMRVPKTTAVTRRKAALNLASFALELTGDDEAQAEVWLRHMLDTLGLHSQGGSRL